MKRITILYIVIIILYTANVFSQSGGVITGKVLNAINKEPIEYVTIAIYGSNIGTFSDEQGNFELRNVPLGFVEIRANALGYEPYISEQIFITRSNTTYVEILLTETIQQIDEVVVRTTPFRTSKESPVSLRTIGLKEIEKNPGGNRDISRVIQSYPGVVSTPAFRNDLIVRGGGPSENRFYIDGIEIPVINHFATQGASGGPIGIINTDFFF